ARPSGGAPGDGKPPPGAGLGAAGDGAPRPGPPGRGAEVPGQGSGAGPRGRPPLLVGGGGGPAPPRGRRARAGRDSQAPAVKPGPSWSKTPRIATGLR